MCALFIEGSDADTVLPSMHLKPPMILNGSTAVRHSKDLTYSEISALIGKLGLSGQVTKYRPLVNGMGVWIILLRRSRSTSLRNSLEGHYVPVVS